MAAVFLEFALQALEQREGVGGGAGEAGDHLVVGKPAQFARVGLDHGLADTDLAVAGDHHMAVLAHGEDGGAVPLLIDCLGHGPLVPT